MNMAKAGKSRKATATPPKPRKKSSGDKVVDDDKVEVVEPPEADEPEAPAAPAEVEGGDGARKRPGKAEPIPMKWKVVGFSDGIPVILLKATEKIAANREAERLQAESSYGNIGVYTIDAKIPIPVAPPPPKKPARKPEKSRRK
jgi:hypothetical protein